ncbi:hypothetical protein ACO0LD_28505 [Undibacterium sp. Ji83W]|uniref:hypothetical protein n=1 Tax=Undibacterium sp. Ji83W TaxID=3413043 RepID=UPI003BF3EB43
MKIVAMILLVVCVAVIFLRPSISTYELKILMDEQFSARTSKHIERIECYAFAKGRDFHGVLQCNYKIRGNGTWEAKEVEFPQYLIGGGDYGFMSYDQITQPRVVISTHAKNDDDPIFSKLDSYWYLSVGKNILDQQPK